MGKALTKADMVQYSFDQVGLNHREAKKIVEQFFEVIRSSLEHNEPLRLSEFGNFEPRDKRQRPGGTPKTSEEISIASRRVVTFKAGLKLKNQIALDAGLSP